LAAGGELTLDGTTWKILDASGHSPGGRALYCAVAAVVIVGDALFQGSIGRTDFHNSRHDRLISNIKTNLLTLPDETRVYSGHGPVTTIGAERRTNPFLA
jgi:glyoxylase-like metal-dependent hydrolase (beta-lactamase superfamily II)